MNFYSMLSSYYNELFPVKPQTLEFVINNVRGNHSLLDIGCGTGTLCHALSGYFDVIHGVDLDESMIEQAKLGDSLNTQFHVVDMLDLENNFGKSEFDVVSCLGNTLAHLSSREDILKALSSMYDVLNNTGVLLIQIVNFDRVENKGKVDLPLLESESVVFRRVYKSIPSAHKTLFWSEIEKKGGCSCENEVVLYSLKKDELEELLLNVGFMQVEVFGGFDGTSWSQDSGPIIAVASK